MAQPRVKPKFLDSSVNQLPEFSQAAGSVDHKTYAAKRDMGIIAILQQMEYTPINLDGRTFYLFDTGTEDGKNKATLVHSEDLLKDGDFCTHYKEIMGEVFPPETLVTIMIMPQSRIDYLLRAAEKTENPDKEIKL